MRIIRGLLFDLDGTLIDSKERFYESYVQAFLGPCGKWQLSRGGGTLPTWRSDGKEPY